MAESGRPDLAFGVIECQQGLATPTVDLIKGMNRAIWRAHEPAAWVVQGLGCSLEGVVCLAASDAPFDSMPCE